MSSTDGTLRRGPISAGVDGVAGISVFRNNHRERYMADQTTRTVLVAEDDPLNRMYLRTILRHRGYEVIEAKTGAEAVRLSQESSPDVILMDLTMPEMNGIEAAIAIRGGSVASGVPIIALTAYDNFDFGAESEDAGMNAFLTKPVSEDELIKVLQQNIGG